MTGRAASVSGGVEEGAGGKEVRTGATLQERTVS